MLDAGGADRAHRSVAYTEASLATSRSVASMIPLRRDRPDAILESRWWSCLRVWGVGIWVWVWEVGCKM